MQKLNKKTVNAIAHNIILDSVLQTAWDFVCSLAPTNDFEYAYTNSATEDYCDTTWHVVQNVVLHESLDLQDANEMYNTAVDNYYNFVNVNLATVSVEDVYESLNSISGDTAMRDTYYSLLREHFKQFVAHNTLYKFVEGEYSYTLTSTHSYADKVQLVTDYLAQYDCADYIQLDNTIN